MNSLSLGFAYICGLSLLLTEVCIGAGNGNWTPLWLFLVFFTLMFAILGCLPLSNKAIDKAGPVFSILIGVGILAYAFGSFGAGSYLAGFLKLLSASLMVVIGLLGFVFKTPEDHSEAH
ncbi:hypothetical protein N9B73_00910 [Verrucomicrobiales bacterium]|nr:hypothetical protein [Verrucomicrobiales bacterium]